MRTLYPNINPFNTFFLKVSDIHEIYVEESGNPQGQPIFRFHGGPGSNSKPTGRRWFDPLKFRIIQFDQRGCGQSTPHGEIRENTTQDLIEDIEKIRKYLNLDKISILGPSWGSTLALAYAQAYPAHVERLILQGVMTYRQLELDLMGFQSTRYHFPEIWEKHTEIVPAEFLDHPMQFFVQEILDKNNRDHTLFRHFRFWEYNIGSLYPNLDALDFAADVLEEDIDKARIFLHYEKHKGFLKDGQLLADENINRIKNIPVSIIQGRYDMVCLPITAWQLHKKLSGSKFEIIDDAGHYSGLPWMADRILRDING